MMRGAWKLAGIHGRVFALMTSNTCSKHKVFDGINVKKKRIQTPLILEAVLRRWRSSPHPLRSSAQIGIWATNLPYTSWCMDQSGASKRLRGRRGVADIWATNRRINVSATMLI
jgi:hypothetical protein